MKRILAALGVAALIGTGAAVAVSSSASAHTGTLATSTSCSTDGSTRTITYTGKTTNVPERGKGHVATLTVGEIAPSGSAIAPATQTVTGNTSYTFTQTVPGTTISGQATAFLKWGDNAKSDPIGKWSESAPCTTPTPEPTPTPTAPTPEPTTTPTPKPVVEPHIQDYITCDGAAFVFDNTGSTVDVTYKIDDKTYVVPAGKAIHTDADGFLFPADHGVYTITATPGDKTWTFAPAEHCATTPPVPTPTPTPSTPVTPVPTPEPTTPVTPQPSHEPTPPVTHTPEPTPPVTHTPEPTTAPTPTASETPKAVTPVVTNHTNTPKGTLAFTGAEGLGYGLSVAILMLLGGAVLMVRRRRKA
jgi:hypothetical protein